MKKIIGVVVAILILMVASVIAQLTKSMLNVTEFGEKLYPSLGKLAFFLEAIIGLSPLIIGIWLVKLSWRKITYKEPTVKSHNENTSNSSLTKAVYNHAKEVASDVKPMVERYKQSHTTARPVDEEQSITTVASVNDDEIYEQVMLEIEEDKKVKSAWARALSQADGDKDKAEALYIQFRVKAIKDEAENIRLKEEEKLLELQREKEKQNKLIAEDREKKLLEFLDRNHLVLNKKISDTKIKANEVGSVYDTYAEYEGGYWVPTNKVLYADS